jgi:hypothetical protein
LWGGNTLACNSCHSAKANDAYWSANSTHKLHWEGADLSTAYSTPPGNITGDATTYRFACSSCHSPSSGAVHANGAASANGAAQVYFGFTSAGRKGSYAYGASQGSTDNGFNWSAGSGCNTTYCHSDGANGNGDPVGWLQTTNSTTSPQVRCALCHGYYGIKLLSTGKHSIHSYYGCNSCHNATTTDGEMIANKTKHVNKQREVVFDPLDPLSAAGTYNAQTKTCSNVHCHQLIVDKTW